MRTQRVSLATGVDLDVTVGGSGDPIVFLHGYPESRATWRHQLAEFEKSHFVVAPDQRGYGESSKPPDVGDYTQEKLAADVIALADALGIERFTLAGHDFGGIVAWSTATRYPDRVARLVIANAPHPVIWQRTILDDPAQRAASQYISFQCRPESQDVVAAMGYGTFFDTRLMVHMNPDVVTPEDRASTIAGWAIPDALRSMNNWYRAMGLTVPEVGEAAELPAWAAEPVHPLTMPTLVIWGVNDPGLMPSQLAGIREVVLGDLTVVELAASHFIPWEVPALVNQAIAAFLVARPVSAQ